MISARSCSSKKVMDVMEAVPSLAGFPRLALLSPFPGVAVANTTYHCAPSRRYPAVHENPLGNLFSRPTPGIVAVRKGRNQRDGAHPRRLGERSRNTQSQRG